MLFSKGILALSLVFGSFVAQAESAKPTEFRDIRISCSEVGWMNADGSIQCNRPFVKGYQTNGIDTLTIDGPLTAKLRKDARINQGRGICALIGYSTYVSMTSEAVPYDSDSSSYGPWVTLNENGAVVALARTGSAFVSSVTCK